MRSLLESLAVVTSPRLRLHALERFGHRHPAVRPGGVWIHAPSVGEANAAIGLGEQLAQPVFITCDTPEAYEILTAWSLLAPGRYAGIRPIDHKAIVGGLWSLARPRALVWIESSWWPTLASLAHRAGTPQFRVSGSVGEGTRRRWRVFGARPKLTGLYARDRASAKAFEAAGEGPVLGIADLKAHAPASKERIRWGRPFVVAGCTYPDELPWLLDALAMTPGRLGLVIAPRHLEQCEAISDSLNSSAMSWLRWTQIVEGTVPDETDVVLVDRMGVLSGLYRGAKAAWIGGTLAENRGAHSPFEAQNAGAGVVTGPFQAPHTQAFRDANATTVHSPADLSAAWLNPTTPPAVQASTGQDIAQHIMRCARVASASPRRPMLTALPGFWHRTFANRTGQMWTTGVKTLAVGGASARGSGKTSLGRQLALQLARNGYRVGVVARGYGRAKGRDTRTSWQTSSGRRLGDDAALYAGDGHLVATGPDRIASARALIGQGADLIVLEDGLQQRQIQADWRVAVVDMSDPEAGGAYPAGDLRNASIVPEGCDATVSLNGQLQNATRAELSPGPWHRGPKAATPVAKMAGFCGVGRAWRVQDLMHPHLAKFRVFPDHVVYSAKRLRALEAWSDGLPLACSRKDYVRLPEAFAETVWWRDITLNIDASSVLPDGWIT